MNWLTFLPKIAPSLSPRITRFSVKHNAKILFQRTNLLKFRLRRIFPPSCLPVSVFQKNIVGITVILWKTVGISVSRTLERPPTSVSGLKTPLMYNKPDHLNWTRDRWSNQLNKDRTQLNGWNTIIERSWISIKYYPNFRVGLKFNYLWLLSIEIRLRSTVYDCLASLWYPVFSDSGNG